MQLKAKGFSLGKLICVAPSFSFENSFSDSQKNFLQHVHIIYVIMGNLHFLFHLQVNQDKGIGFVHKSKFFLTYILSSSVKPFRLANKIF